MSDDTRETPDATGQRLVGPFGVAYCERALARIKKLQGLIQNDRKWSYETPFRPPIESLLPPGTPKDQHYEMTKKEIARLAPLVHRYLVWAGVPTVFEFESRVRNPQTNQPEEQTWDVIGDYPNLPSDESSAVIYRAIQQALDGGIGIYDAMLERARARRWNPLFWVAMLLRAPLTVLDYAGLTDDKTRPGIVKGYGWVVRILFLIVLGLIATRLGISGWTKLISLVK